ncbi:MAG: hypothetical protein IT454_07195 [Planctomycetes bacterium]|nr:hypothetical protein [Planctomycetota bacterium]
MLLRVVAVVALAISVFVQDASHTAAVSSEHFEVRYRPGSKAGAFVEREAAHAERDLAEICKALEIELAGRYRLFLYDDVEDLSRTTGTSGNAGFSAGDASHVPVSNDQTRFHELVHIVAYDRIKRSGDEPRNLFFAEGLSNAMLVFVHGVHVHSVARYYLDERVLPPLTEMTGAADFYAWLGAHPGFNAYDVAGSYMRFLLDTYGAKKTARYYGGASASSAFGVDAARVEKAWRDALARYELRPEVRALLAERHGESARIAAELARPAGLPDELLGKPSDWRSLAAQELRPHNGAEWKRKGDSLVGRSDEQAWSVCELGSELFGDCAVRATIHTPAPIPIQLRLGPGNQAMLVNGTFLYRGELPVASSQLASMGAGRTQTDFVLVRRAGQIEIWIDGRRCLTSAADATPSAVGLAFHGGEVRFEDVRVRKL